MLGLVFVLLVSFLDAKSSAASRTSTRASPARERRAPGAAPDLRLDELSPSANPAAGRAPPLPSRPIPAYTRTDPRDQGPDEAIRRVARQQRYRFLGSARGASRHHRAERRGQEHLLQNAHLRDSSDFGNDHLRGQRHYRARSHRSLPDGPDQELPGQPIVQPADGAPEHRDLGFGGKARLFPRWTCCATPRTSRSSTIWSTIRWTWSS